MLDFIRQSPGPVGKRDIARRFAIKGALRIPLKALLKELAREGHFDRGRSTAKAKGPGGALPETMVLQAIGTDAEGDLWARPCDPGDGESEIRILVIEPRSEKGTRPPAPLSPGDRFLAHLRFAMDEGFYEARPIRRLESHSERIVGQLSAGPNGSGRLRPTDKRLRTEFAIAPGDLAGAEPGEIVVASIEPARRSVQPRARILERLGPFGAAQSISMISIAEQGLPFVFPPASLAEAAAAGPTGLGRRRDWRNLPLVTIDGEDARDFDDAVWAAPDADPANPGGYRLIVAIADVAYYVRPDSALDREARRRGNSVYFPDRVIPMLPEALANGWCSLKPGEDRPAMAVEIVIDAMGKKRRHNFQRILMRSVARLTYERVQAAMEGRPDAETRSLREAVILPLYGAFRALDTARRERGTLDLDIAERRVIMADNRIERIEPRQRLDSHRLIEEFMIAANVAAAESLEKKHYPCLYRVHDAPDAARIEALRQFLHGLDLRLAKGQGLRPRHFTALLAAAKTTPYAALINALVLRAQSQAVYAPENIGHFGLALARYAHFTSPIRRYADLVVHRALIGAYDLGEDGIDREPREDLAEIAQHISATERRAAMAERNAVDRYTAAYLAKREGEVFAGRISGVARFGLFVNLDETGADGLVPIALLPGDFYDHDEGRHALIGRRHGQIFRLGDAVEIRLLKTDPLTGGLTFEIMSGGSAATADRSQSRRPRASRKAPPARPRPGQAKSRKARSRSAPKRNK